jgi:GT2 family glycosyltransferase
VCQDQSSQVRLIQNTHNTGFAYANNQAFDVACGDYLLLLNADTEVTLNALDMLVSCTNSDSRIGLCTARLVNPDGSTQVGFNVRRLPTLSSMAAQLLLIDELWPQNPVSRRYYCLDLDYDQLQDVEQPAASALLLNRRTLLSVGGFDPQFTNWFNDVDLCARVLKAGWRNVYCPSSVILHLGGMGSASRTATDVMIEAYRNQRRYARKHHGFIGYSLVTFLVLLGMVMRIVVLAVLPNSSRRTQLSVRSAESTDLLSAYRAVFLDTAHTWISLQPVSTPGDKNQ